MSKTASITLSYAGLNPVTYIPLLAVHSVGESNEMKGTKVTTRDQAIEAAKVKPSDRTPLEQSRVDDCWNIQAVRNADFTARGNKPRG